jgi:hypothetical protein
MKNRTGLLASLAALIGAAPLTAQITTRGYVAITPCRMVDTRVDSSGGPITATVRNLTLTGAAYSGVPASHNPCTASTGAPAMVAFVAVNFTMTDMTGASDLRVAPWGTAPATSIMNSIAGLNIAQAVTEIVASDGAGQKGISVKAGGTSFNLVIDVLGYYTNILSSTTAVLNGTNTGTGRGVYGQTVSVYGVDGEAVGTTGANYGVVGQTQSNAGTGVYGGARNTSTVGGGTIGVWGENLATSGAGFGVYGNTATATSPSAGVYGFTSASSGNGVVGEANVGPFSYGVWGKSTAGLAGYFTGNVSVIGTLSKTAGSFKIDHPLDPAHKYLSHSFVESPDMMNIYNGIAVLDMRGEAVVGLPDWFEALNKDYRYQLTAIGHSGRDLYIAREISGNKFTIGGGVPNMKVSWMVTGIRHDAYAQAHRIPVETRKTGAEDGTYLYPALFGAGPEKSVDAAKSAPVEK